MNRFPQDQPYGVMFQSKDPRKQKEMRREEEFKLDTSGFVESNEDEFKPDIDIENIK